MNSQLPTAPSSIEAGKSLAVLLDAGAVDYLGNNLRLAWPDFDAAGFRNDVLPGLDELALMDRARHIARTLRVWLPPIYEDALDILVRSLTPPTIATEGNGLSGFFYLPHSFFIAEFGLDPAGNAGRDPFDASILAQHELTRRFTAEFCIRPFLIHRTRETLDRLMAWTLDADPHVRRLCSEGTRPRLPWGLRLKSFMIDPSPALPILEALKDDPELYVRRSVANHLGDIAKDHPEVAFEICRRWSEGADKNRRWVIRHAVRYYAKRGHPTALDLRRVNAAR